MSGLSFASRAEIEAQQLGALRKLLRSIIPGNSFYTSRLRGAGLDAAPSSLMDFIERCPFTTKAELIEDQHRHPPYGTNLTYPIEQYTRLHQTSSTTGTPLRWLDTKESWSWLVAGWEVILRAAGVEARDRVFVAFSFGPFLGLWLAYEAASRMGCLSIPGGAMTSVTRLRIIMGNEVSVLACTPTYAIHLGEVAASEGLDLAEATVRTIIVGGEPGGSVPATRSRIESLWPTARVFDHHGMTEVGPVTYQCSDRPGVLHVNEYAYLAEVIDTESCAPIEFGSGVKGELVLTTLGRDSSPLLRYRTGDLVEPGPAETCACGRNLLTLERGIIGRIDDMVFIRGVNIYPSAVDQIIHNCGGVAEYRCEITDNHALTELHILVEPKSDVDDTASLCRKLQRAFREAYSLRVPIEVVPAGTLPRFELKARRWVRKQEVK